MPPSPSNTLAAHIAADRWLWTLEQAYDDLELLHLPELPAAKRIKHGERRVIQMRLKAALRALERLDF